MIQALQLANVKLLSEGGLSADREESDRQLTSIAECLNQYIRPTNNLDQVRLVDLFLSKDLIFEH